MFADAVVATIVIFVVLFVVGFLALLVKCYQKVCQGQALIRNGVGGTKVSFSGLFVIPILHRAEYMDISVKRIENDRRAGPGLICKDNLRADIVVAFFVRVNNTTQDVVKVAQSLGCERASDRQALVELFDAKFSEALKTVGKQFDFSDLYTNRMRFREQILEIIGTDLSGYILEDAAIDYLEQTDKSILKPDNILDAEGIKKITLLTAEQFEMANAREREKDKTITRQNVEA
ncbi:MAG: SPFH domain-containing protein, partial [Phycisphaerales bacterium]